MRGNMKSLKKQLDETFQSLLMLGLATLILVYVSGLTEDMFVREGFILPAWVWTSMGFMIPWCLVVVQVWLVVKMVWITKDMNTVRRMGQEIDCKTSDKEAELDEIIDRLNNSM